MVNEICLSDENDIRSFLLEIAIFVSLENLVLTLQSTRLVQDLQASFTILANAQKFR